MRSRVAGRRTTPGRETAHRFSQRARAERRRRQRLLLTGMGVVSLLGAALWLVAHSALLRVAAVTVTGAHREPVTHILEAAHVPDQAAMWRLDTSAIERRVAALPRVRSVAVTRSWPRTVRIAITERQPVAAVALPTGSQVVVDSAGAEIERVPAPPTGLLRVRLSAATLADTPAARAPLVSAALTVAVALPPAIRARVDVITVATPADVSVLLAGGSLVRWGGADRSDRKAEVLTALLVSPQQLYDVRAPDTPAVR